MVLQFRIKSNIPEESQPVIRFAEGDEEREMELSFVKTGEDLWEVNIRRDEHRFKKKLEYSILFKSTNDEPPAEIVVLRDRFSLKGKGIIKVTYENIESRKLKKLGRNPMFSIVAEKTKPVKMKAVKEPTHIFRSSAGILEENKYLCITGSAKKLNQWNPGEPIILDPKKKLKLNFSKEHFPIEYKMAVWDAKEKKITAYEHGSNRVIEKTDLDNELNIIFLPEVFNSFAWKGAGINVPVSALRREGGWGTGEFTDLHKLVDWAADAGFKMIQLLPLYDTTATFTDKDSYPYNPLSSFALHPQFLNVQKLATACSFEISEEHKAERERLESAASLDNPAVMKLKLAVLREIFAVEKEDFKDDMDWFSFFDLNREWLTPYAAFCCLRDKYKTADTQQWSEFAHYKEEDVQDLASHESEAYDEILFWYFVQYHLHLQLKDAADYAHKNGIVFKADLPIGAGRHSVDTWVSPELFDLQMQAGAPPDFFTPKGQNWSFPTYNWTAMEADDYSWFRKRLEHMQTYFSAMRIDHVLGFFRIWSIPANQYEGLLGRFMPAVPLTNHTFTNAGIKFDRVRLCEPFITEELMLDKFGEDAEEVKAMFFEEGKLKKEFDDQQKVKAYFKLNPTDEKWQQGLFDVITNVILLDAGGGAYHFRIDIHLSNSFLHLEEDLQQKLRILYHQYFFENQQGLWRKEGEKKLKMLKENTSMLLCAEDLGMVPDFTEDVLHSLDMLSLDVQQVGKYGNTNFSDISAADYESVVMPGTHDMATIREWWESQRDRAQYFFTNILKEKGEAPYFCEPWICKKIIEIHLQSPAMLSIFLLQDVIAMNGNLRRANPYEERINDPANNDHVWNYRTHISLNKLAEEKAFTQEIHSMIKSGNR